MSTKTLARGTTFAFGSGFGLAPTVYRKDSGVLVVERAAMFRSGTFRDSMGTQNTWEKLHLKQMIDNYEHLRDNKLFDDIPVRDGHSGWLIHDMPGNGQVVGWHDKIWTEELEAPHDGQKYDYLLADVRITDPEAALKVENGTFRNRSAEIGGYSTNDEAEFWPVYRGVAYVDIPAVEGLKFSSSNNTPDRKVYVFMDSKETSVATEPTTTGQPQGTPAPLLGVPAPTQSFSINGQPSADVVAVQNHITVLEKFRSETAEANRVNYVNQLATTQKILATQVDGLLAFAKTLTDEQFAEWQKTYDATPAQPILGNHAGGVSNSTGQAATPTTADAQVEVDLEVVKMHTRAGTPKAQLEGMASYKRLLAAGKLPA